MWKVRFLRIIHFNPCGGDLLKLANMNINENFFGGRERERERRNMKSEKLIFCVEKERKRNENTK